MFNRSVFSMAALALGTILAAPTSSAEELSTYTGAQLYTRFCAACHGRTAEGNGPVAPFFKLAPPDLTQLAKRRGGEFPTEKLQQIIDGRANLAPHGSRQMPVWGIEFVSAEGTAAEGRAGADTLIARLVEYLRSLQVS